MSKKFKTADHYAVDVTRNCEIALALLLRSFGSLKDSIRLVGGLVPRYLVPAQPPEIPSHVGTTDVDMLLNVSVLAKKGAYAQLKEQLKNNGFSRYIKDDGTPSSWQWVCEVNGQSIVVEFLQSTTDQSLSGRLTSVDGEGVSAMQFLHAAVAYDWYEQTEIKVEMPTGGIASEYLRYADPVAFITLKTIAFDHRREPKDVADLVHVIRFWGYSSADIDQLVAAFEQRIKTRLHTEALKKTFDLLERHFCDDAEIEGWQKEGPSMLANFYQIGVPGSDEHVRERRTVSSLVTYFVNEVRRRCREILSAHLQQQTQP